MSACSNLVLTSKDRAPYGRARKVEDTVLSNSAPPVAVRSDSLAAISVRRQSRTWFDSLALWLLSAFAFVLPTDLRLPGDRSIAMRLGYLCLILGFAGVLKRRFVIPPQRGFWLIFAFVLWSSSTLAWASFPDLAQHKILLYWAVFAASAIVPQYAWDPEVRARLLKSFVAGCALGVLGTAVNFMRGMPFLAEGEDAIEGRYSFGTDPNYLGLALVIGIPLALYAAQTAQARWQRTALRLYLPTAVAGVLLTGSRGALIALFAVAVTYMVRAIPRMRMRLLGGAVLGVTLLALVPTQLSERFVTIPDALRYGSFSDRRELWDRGVTTARDNLLQGVGAGASAGILSIAAHNTPLELTMEGGLASLALFYGAFLLGLRQTLELDGNEGWSMLAACAAWLIGCLALSWEIQTVSWFLVMILNSAVPVRSVVGQANVTAESLRASAS